MCKNFIFNYSFRSSFKFNNKTFNVFIFMMRRDILSKHGGNIEEVARRLNISSKEFLDFSANINPLGFIRKGKKKYRKKYIKNRKIS